MEPETATLLEPAARRSHHGRAKQVLTTIVVDILAFVFGMAMGWSSTTLPLLLSDASPLSSGRIQDGDASWLASVLCVVAIFTTPFHHYICEKYGRKACGYATVLPAIVSTVLLIVGHSVTALYLSRIIMGASAGATFIFCPIYVAEIAEDEIRGALGVIIMLMRNLGILSAYVIGSYFSYSVVSWICFVPTILFFLCLIVLPETPIYLLRKNRYEDAVKSLQFFRGDDADVTLEIQKLSHLVQMDSNKNDCPSVRDMFADRTARRALLIAFVLFCNQQLCGFYGIVSYSLDIFKAAGTDLSANTCSIIIGVMLVLGTVASVFLCEILGRKTLLIVSNVLLTITLAVLATHIYLKEKGWDTKMFDWTPVTCLSVYVVGMNIGLASLPVLVTTEIFSPRFTSLAMTITSPTTWLLTFLVAKYFPAVSGSIGIHGSYMIFLAVCLGGAIFTKMYLPETKNRPLQSILEEINSNFSRRRATYPEEYPLTPV